VFTSIAQAAGLDDEITAHAACRYRIGGYWVAGAEPEAARHAVTEAITPRLHRLAVMTDGVACVAEDYQEVTWGGLLDVAGK